MHQIGTCWRGVVRFLVRCFVILDFGAGCSEGCCLSTTVASLGLQSPRSKSATTPISSATALHAESIPHKFSSLPPALCRFLHLPLLLGCCLRCCLHYRGGPSSRLIHPSHTSSMLLHV
ncbi:hypothetical protein FPQ18DRAFT_166060 [Pyronema domesticum]|nr:hypothetical protein FPQ18DRAFT_166060 [Pyronema domesticum]